MKKSTKKMPASTSPNVPEIGIECNEFAFLSGQYKGKDGDAFTFLQGSSGPNSFEKQGWLLSSGATTPGEESSELDDQSDYEFRADGQEEYYDFLREMGCEFQQTPDDEEEETELEDEVDAEFTADGQEEYYDFLRELGCPFEERVDDDVEEEEEVEDWDGTEEWFEDGTNNVTDTSQKDVQEANKIPARDLNILDDAGIETQPAYDDDDDVAVSRRPFGSPVSIAPGPSLWLQKALINVAAQRTAELSLPSAASSATMSWEIINCKDIQSC